MYQINIPTERQHYFLNKDTKRNDNLFVIQHNYDSDFTGDLYVQDTAARPSLLEYASQNL